MKPRPDIWTGFHAASGSCNFVVSDPRTHRAAVIDPVLDFDLPRGRVSLDMVEQILRHLDAHELELEWILDTHTHADHLSAAAVLRERAGGHTGIGASIVAMQAACASLFNLNGAVPADGSQFDRLFADGESFALGALEVTALATPGHTADGMTYLIGDAAFVGDTLLSPANGTARCDLPGGDPAVLYRSIRRLYELPDTTRVFVGHDYPPEGRAPDCESTIGAHKAGNSHANAAISREAFVALRTARDRTLPPPTCWIPALQVNIRAGALPPPEANGRRYFKYPVEFA